MAGTGKGNYHCPNGHTANQYEQCFESSCRYYVRGDTPPPNERGKQNPPK